MLEDLLGGPPIEARKELAKMKTRASERVQPILAYIESNLFDHRLSVKGMLAFLRNTGGNGRFRAELGETPYQVIQRLRILTARSLLRRTDLEIWKISELLGYSRLGTFSKAFCRLEGVRPNVFRNLMQDEISRTGKGFSRDQLERAEAGLLTPEESRRLIGALIRRYPSWRSVVKASESEA